MNLAYNTNSNIPQHNAVISAGQINTDLANNYADSLNDPYAIDPLVVARIPYVDAPASPSKPKHHYHSSRSRTTKTWPITTSASGRLISAGLSLKLLISIALVLLIGALGPYFVIKITDNTQSSTDKALEQAWQTTPPVPMADLAPVWIHPTPQSPTSSYISPNSLLKNRTGSNLVGQQSDANKGSQLPVPLFQQAANTCESPVAASKQFLTSNNTIDREKTSAENKSIVAMDNESDVSSWPQPGKSESAWTALTQNLPRTRTVAENANYSQWPNPAHPIYTQADPRLNKPYTADRRSEPLSAGAVRMPLIQPIRNSSSAQPSSESDTGAAHFEGTINPPYDRNIYDSSRPSIH